jgi:hypothetical protein
VARSTGAASPTARDVQVVVADFLVRQHFSVSVAEQAEEGRPSITATSGPCRMLVAQSPALGWDQDVIRRYAQPDDHVFVVFGGHIYADQPTLSTTFDALKSRLWRQLGGHVRLNPVLAVIAKPACEAEGLPWGGILADRP